MEQSGGKIAAKLAKAPDGGEDRLSALPDETLVLILECLDTTAEAARTSVLAHRWRGLWRLLSKLHFHLRPDDGNRIRELLDVADAPALRHVSVTTKGAAADSATAWLRAAARRLADGGGLVYHNMAPDLEEERARTRRRGGNVQLPCFANATTIELRLRFLGLALPSQGVFTRLTDLYLSSTEFRDPCELGDLVSSQRCPCLQKLSIGYSWGLGNLSIHSESLLQMELMFCNLRQLTIVAPLLQKLSVHGNFRAAIGGVDQSELQGANITAPQIVSLVWMDRYDPRYFHLGQPRKLQTGHFYVYGQQLRGERNHSCLKLLQQFKVLYSLHLSLVYIKQDICYQYLLGDMTALKTLKMTLVNEMTEGKIAEFRQALAGSFRPETCVQFNTSDSK